MADKTAEALEEAAYELNEVVCAFLNGEHPFDRADKAVNAYEALASQVREAQPVADEEVRSTEKVQPTLDELVAFLCGERELMGYWYGAGPAKAPYWWRKHLRAAAQSANAANVERDAARYRWLRQRPVSCPLLIDDGLYRGGSLLDAAIDAAMRQSAPLQPHSEEDGFGNGWECTRGLPTGKCGMQIVRPGKVQCDICDSRSDKEQP